MIHLFSLLFIFLFFPTGLSMALDSDRNQTAIVDAQDIEIDFATGRRIYRGEVTIQQGTLHMTANEIRLYFDGDVLERAIAIGQPAVFRQQPEGSNYFIKGQAQKIELNQLENILIFSGEAKLQQHRDMVTGETIIYHMETEKMTVRGNTATPGQTTRLSTSQKTTNIKDNKNNLSTRPKIVIQPESNPIPEESLNNSLDSSVLSTANNTGQEPTAESTNGQTVHEIKLEPAGDALQFRAARIIGAGTAAYSEPSETAELLGGLSSGTPVKVLEIRSDWARVITPGGINVWVFASYLTENSDGKARIKGRGVRARWLPSIDSRIVGIFEFGTQVRILSTRDNWKQVSLPSSVAVWIPVTQLKILEEINLTWQNEWATHTGILSRTNN